MKKLSENYAIIFEESGPTGRYETVNVKIIRSVANTKLDLYEIGPIERKDSISGHLAFFLEIVKQLQVFRKNEYAEHLFIDNRKKTEDGQE